MGHSAVYLKWHLIEDSFIRISFYRYLKSREMMSQNMIIDTHTLVYDADKLTIDSQSYLIKELSKISFNYYQPQTTNAFLWITRICTLFALSTIFTPISQIVTNGSITEAHNLMKLVPIMIFFMILLVILVFPWLIPLYVAKNTIIIRSRHRPEQLISFKAFKGIDIVRMLCMRVQPQMVIHAQVSPILEMVEYINEAIHAQEQS